MYHFFAFVLFLYLFGFFLCFFYFLYFCFKGVVARRRMSDARLSRSPSLTSGESGYAVYGDGYGEGYNVYFNI